jgi:hypothetical protein
MDLQSINVCIKMFRDALDSAKAVKDFFPKGSKKEQEQFEINLANAERQTVLIESQLALALGYKLCLCTFPPQIMLQTGMIDGRWNYSCPKCGADSVPRFRPTKAETDFDIFGR